MRDAAEASGAPTNDGPATAAPERDAAGAPAAAGDGAGGGITVAAPPPPDAAAPAAPSRPGLGRAFWTLCAAFGLSNLGVGITSVAAPWLTTSVTRDPVLVAGVGMAAELPWLLFSLPIGALIDRLEHSKVISTTHLLRALLIATIAVAVFTDNVTLVLLYSVAFLIGTLTVANENAHQTILPRVVATGKLERANSNLELTDTTIGVFIGPMLGGLLVAVSLGVPFALNALLFAAAAGLLMTMKVPPRKPRTTRSRALRREMADGARYFWRHPVLRSLGITLAVLNLSSGVAVGTQVLFAQEILHLNSIQYGLMFSVGAVGAAIGAAIAPTLERRLGARRVLLLTLLGNTLVAFSISVAFSALLVAAALAVGAGLAVSWNVLTISYRQRIVPEDMLGRVNSIYRLISWGPLPVGTLASGVVVAMVTPLLGREIGLRAPLAVAGLITLATLLYAARLRKGIWSRDPAEYRTAVGPAPPEPSGAVPTDAEPTDAEPSDAEERRA